MFFNEKALVFLSFEEERLFDCFEVTSLTVNTNCVEINIDFLLENGVGSYQGLMIIEVHKIDIADNSELVVIKSF